MSDNKNIDRLFQEKFKDFEVFPEPNVWKGIENELMKKKKRRIIPLWLRLAGAAAILLLLIPVGYKFYNNNDIKPDTQDTNVITNTETNDAISNEKQSSEGGSNSEKSTSDKDPISTNVEERVITTTQQQSERKHTTTKNVATTNQKISADNILTSVNNLVSEEKTVHQQEDKVANQFENLKEALETVETEVAVSENLEEEEKSNFLDEIEKQNLIDNVVDVNDKKWSIGSTIGPVYLNSSGKGSPIDPSLADNTKSSNNSISYGLKVNYKISNKFSLQSGIQNVDLGYSTANVTVVASSSTLLSKSETNINSDIGGTLEVSSTASKHPETFSQRSPFDSDGSLDQSYSYVEVPLEAKYAIVQKKLGVQLVGGVSTYFLYDNDVSITSFGKKTSLGEASNLNNLNFSGNVGLDLNYNLSPNLFINASPMVKYQLNTFSENSGGFKPYFFGVYGGLNFRF